MLPDRYRHRPHLEYDMPLPDDWSDRDDLEDREVSGFYDEVDEEYSHQFSTAEEWNGSDTWR